MASEIFSQIYDAEVSSNGETVTLATNVVTSGEDTVSSTNPVLIAGDQFQASFTSDAIDYIGTVKDSAGNVVGFIGTDLSTGQSYVFATGDEKPLGVLTIDYSHGPGTGADWDLTTGGALCYMSGTAISTPTGETPVELLKVGDLVTTHDGTQAPVVWVGQWQVDLDRQLKSEKVRPVCIAANALDVNIPCRDLYVSPDHSIYLQGVLVPAYLLVNGQTITQPERRGTVDYYHVQIEPHGLLVAEGAVAESFLNIHRSAFSKSDEEPRNWEDACAPIVLGGPMLSRIRQDLMARVKIAA